MKQEEMYQRFRAMTLSFEYLEEAEKFVDGHEAHFENCITHQRPCLVLEVTQEHLRYSIGEVLTNRGFKVHWRYHRREIFVSGWCHIQIDQFMDAYYKDKEIQYIRVEPVGKELHDYRRDITRALKAIG